jgi:hypothetical protein
MYTVRFRQQTICDLPKRVVESVTNADMNTASTVRMSNR